MDADTHCRAAIVAIYMERSRQCPFDLENHEKLFAKGEKRIDLLTQTSSNFFRMVQDAFLLSIQLTVSKMSDPPQMGQFENLNLAKLAEEIHKLDPNPDVIEIAGFRTRIRASLAEFARDSSRIKERRNKFLAHPDYDTALNTRPVPLLTVTRTEIETALASLRAFMQEIENYFEEIPTAYANPVLTWDGDLLVEALKRSKRYSELEREGVISYQDWRKSPWSDA